MFRHLNTCSAESANALIEFSVRIGYFRRQVTFRRFVLHPNVAPEFTRSL